jgi:glutamate racemase
MIGVIDAGVGGLRVVAALLKTLPGQDIVYYADTARAPYGNRSAETIVRGALEGAERVWRSGARILVAASHTISAVAADALARSFGGTLFDAATTAVEMAIESSRRSRIGLVASRATVESRRYEELIRERCPAAVVCVAACPLWAPLVEEGWQKRREAALIVKRGVRAVKQRTVDTLILGSNAFVPLQPVIQRKIGPQVVLVEASARLASRVTEHLEVQGPSSSPASGGGKVQLWVSDLTPQVAEAARMICGRDVKLERAV